MNELSKVEPKFPRLIDIWVKAPIDAVEMDKCAIFYCNHNRPKVVGGHPASLTVHLGNFPNCRNNKRKNVVPFPFSLATDVHLYSFCILISALDLESSFGGRINCLMSENLENASFQGKLQGDSLNRCAMRFSLS